MKTIAFLNNKGGVGKTTLVYHLAWMFREMGYSVLAADFDPQSNLTTAFVPEDRLERLWPPNQPPRTILGSVQPLIDHLGDIRAPQPYLVTSDLSLLPGDLGLSMFEDRLARAWGACLEDNAGNRNDAFRVTTAFFRAVQLAGRETHSNLALIDVGPSLGSLNRSALIAADYVVVPIGAGLFSLQGLRNLGPALRTWSREWATRMDQQVPDGLELPAGERMRPVGYVVLQHAVRLDRPVKAYQRWLDRVPDVYAECVLESSVLRAGHDENQLGTLKHYRSLMPLAQDARKPMFLLRSADGAIGGHAAAVADCYDDFKRIAKRIAQRCGLTAPSPA